MYTYSWFTESVSELSAAHAFCLENSSMDSFLTVVLLLLSDVNECDNNPCPASSQCSNTDGSFACTCLSGFQRNGTVCDSKWMAVWLLCLAGFLLCLLENVVSTESTERLVCVGMCVCVCACVHMCNCKCIWHNNMHYECTCVHDHSLI